MSIRFLSYIQGERPPLDALPKDCPAKVYSYMHIISIEYVYTPHSHIINSYTTHTYYTNAIPVHSLYIHLPCIYTYSIQFIYAYTYAIYKVARMLECCWSEERTKRKSAIECFSILQQQHGILSMIMYDVCLSHDPVNGLPLLAQCIFHRLSQLGYRVYFDQSGGAVSPRTGVADADPTTPIAPPTHTPYSLPHQSPSPNTRMNNTNTTTHSAPHTPTNPPLINNTDIELYETKESIMSEISNTDNYSLKSTQTIALYNKHIVSSCDVFICIINKSYQNDEYCMSQLRAAKAIKPPRPIIPIFIQSNWLTWANQELIYLCQLRSSTLVSLDLSELAADGNWGGSGGGNNNNTSSGGGEAGGGGDGEGSEGYIGIITTEQSIKLNKLLLSLTPHLPSIQE